MMNVMRATNNYKANKKAIERACMTHKRIWDERTKEYVTLDCVVFFKNEKVNPAAYFADANDVTAKLRPVYEISGSAINDTFAVTECVSTAVYTNMMGNKIALNMHNKHCKRNEAIEKVVFSSGIVIYPEA